MSERTWIRVSAHDLPRLSAADVVRYARNLKGKSQSEFAPEVGKSQSIISKYERGELEPPTEVVDYCMTILVTDKLSNEISLDEVIDRLRQSASLPIAPLLFRAVVSIIDTASVAGKLSLQS